MAKVVEEATSFEEVVQRDRLGRFFLRIRVDGLAVDIDVQVLFEKQVQIKVCLTCSNMKAVGWRIQFSKLLLNCLVDGGSANDGRDG